jgi:hypothetical protein
MLLLPVLWLGKYHTYSHGKRKGKVPASSTQSCRVKQNYCHNYCTTFQYTGPLSVTLISTIFFLISTEIKIHFHWCVLFCDYSCNVLIFDRNAVNLLHL